MKSAIVQLSLAGVVCLAAMSAVSVEAQTQDPLFDKFNVNAEFSFLDLTTQIRLDSETLGKGTTVTFEDDLQLGSSKSVPALGFQWQVGKRHRLALRWQDINRDSSSQTLTEIQWGDEVIPIEANVTLAFDISQYFFDYTYFPWVRERWAAGFGLGVRLMDIAVELAWNEEYIGQGGVEATDATGPLPYLYFEYRRLLSDHWRFVTGLGWLGVTVGDIDGSQWIGRVSTEYLLGAHWSLGASVNIAKVDVDWEGLERRDGENELYGHVDMDINDISLFVRLRY